MEYKVDNEKMKRCLVERGYRGLSELAGRSGLHRNTLQNLLSGQCVFKASFMNLCDHLGADPLEMLVPQASLRAKVKGIEEIGGIVGWLVGQDPSLSIVLLGSHARSRSKRYSDWDLGLFRYPVPLSGRGYLRLKNEVEERSENLVRKVDLINLNQAPRWFLEGLSEEPVFLEGNNEGFTYFRGLIHGVQREQAA